MGGSQLIEHAEVDFQQKNKYKAPPNYNVCLQVSVVAGGRQGARDIRGGGTCQSRYIEADRQTDRQGS